jgi:hypothetical protein
MSAAFVSKPARFAIAVAVLLVTQLAFGEQGTTEATSATPAAAAAAASGAVELYKLKNDDLIKQATELFDKADVDYRAHRRELTTAAMLLADARVELAEVKVPAPPATAPFDKVTTAPASPRAAVDAAKVRKAAVDRKLQLAEKQKALLERLASAVDSAQTAETAFLNALDDLHAYAVEIGLRVDDGSLKASAVPQPVTADALAWKKGQLLTGRQTRQDLSAAVTREQETAAKELDDAARASRAAEAELAQASNTLTLEEKSAEVEKQYTGKSAAELAAELNALAEDGIGLKGTFELGLAQFNGALAEVDKLRKAIDAAKTPEVKIPQLSRLEDVQQAAAGTGRLIEYYTSRVKMLEGLGAAQASALKLGTEFAADATVSSEHLFKMRVIADVLKKQGGQGGAGGDGGLIVQATPQKVLNAAERESGQVTLAQAAMEKIKADAPLVEKQLANARENLSSATDQLQRLKQSQDTTLASLSWEGQIKGMKADQAVAAFADSSKALTQNLAGVEQQHKEYESWLGKVTNLLTKFEELKDPFLRAAEDAGQAEKAKILGELRKEAGLERAAPDAATAASAAATPASAPKADAVPQATPAGAPAAPGAVGTKPAPLQKAIQSLQDFQQLISGRLRVLDDRDAVGKDVVAAIAALDKADHGYEGALAEARQAELKVHVVAIDLKKRVGRGDLTGDQLPAGVADALKPELRARLDSDAADLLATVQRLRQTSESLQKADPVADDAKAKTRQILKLVGQRLDLLADLGRLQAAYDVAPKDRDPGDAKRLVEEAAERQDGESSTLDTLLAIDTSKRATGLADLLESDYRELIELELKEDNLRQQRDIASKLVDLAQQEQTIITSVLPVLESQVKSLEATRDQEAVLAKARLRPEQADELLKAFTVSTGRQLAKPLPVGEKEKPEKVVELAGAIFEQEVQVVAAKNWAAALSARLAPGGIKSEAGVYQDEVARANAASGGNSRHIEALTGQDLPAPGTSEAATVTGRQKFQAAGGSIANTRMELSKARRHGVIVIAVKIAAIILAALLLPLLIRPLLRRTLGAKVAADEHGNTSLVLSAMHTFVKTAVWIIAVALMLSVLGFDITAIVAGLGIGGLAIGLAAQPMISDVIGSIVIFAERKFSIGDVIRIGDAEPAKVVGLSWRGTQLKGFDGQVISVPNRNITSKTIRNLTKDGRTFDSVNIRIKTQNEVGKVLAVIKQATEGCQHLAGGHGFVVKQYRLAGKTRLIKYQFWWYLRDYDVRNQTRDEVFDRISSSVLGEDLAGTEITLA